MQDEEDQANEELLGSYREQTVKYSELMPANVDKKKMELMVKDDDDEMYQFSKKAAEDWIDRFLQEVDHVEEFYKKKLNELIESFIKVQEKFRYRAEIYED